MHHYIVLHQKADHVGWELTSEPDFAACLHVAADCDAAVEAAMATWPEAVPHADIEVIYWESEDCGDTYGWVRVRHGSWRFHFGHK